MHRTHNVGKMKFDRILRRAVKSNTALAVVILSISDICNRSCVHCPRGQGYIHPDIPYFMPLSTVEKLCHQLGDYRGSISISGLGEPLLHPQIKEITSRIKTLCPNCWLFLITNGDFLRDEIFAYFDDVFISAYSDEDYDHFMKMFPRAKVLRQDVKHFNNRAGNVYKCDQPTGGCMMPFFQCTVDTDGKVYQCSCDWKRECPLGDINKEDIYKIFKYGFRELREKLYYGERHETQLCSRCNATGFHTELTDIFIDKWIKEEL